MKFSLSTNNSYVNSYLQLFERSFSSNNRDNYDKNDTRISNINILAIKWNNK